MQIQVVDDLVDNGHRVYIFGEKRWETIGGLGAGERLDLGLVLKGPSDYFVKNDLKVSQR